MNYSNSDIQNKFNGLKQYQQQYIDEILSTLVNVNIVDVNEHFNTDIRCTECDSNRMIKHGGNRFKCKCCGSTQSITKGTVLYRVQNKDKWVDFVYLMLSEEKALSLNDIRKRVPMTLKTAHAWRHRFLTSMIDIYSKFFSADNIQSSTIELDEVYLRFNVKGRLGKEKYKDFDKKVPTEFRELEAIRASDKHQTVFACLNDREGNFAFLPIKTIKKGLVSKQDLDKALKGIDFKGKTIVTDSGTSICSYVNGLKANEEFAVTHKSFVSADVKKGIIEEEHHNNNINNIMMLFRRWSKDFNGYSSKYQWNYLAWFKLTRMFKEGMKGLENVVTESLNISSHTQYKDIFKYYQTFAS